MQTRFRNIFTIFDETGSGFFFILVLLFFSVKKDVNMKEKTRHQR